VLWKPKMPRTPASYVSADRSDGGEDSLLDLANPGDALTCRTCVAAMAPVRQSCMPRQRSRRAGLISVCDIAAPGGQRVRSSKFPKHCPHCRDNLLPRRRLRCPGQRRQAERQHRPRPAARRRRRRVGCGRLRRPAAAAARQRQRRTRYSGGLVGARRAAGAADHQPRRCHAAPLRQPVQRPGESRNILRCRTVFLGVAQQEMVAVPRNSRRKPVTNACPRCIASAQPDDVVLTLAHCSSIRK